MPILNQEIAPSGSKGNNRKSYLFILLVFFLLTLFLFSFLNSKKSTSPKNINEQKSPEVFQIGTASTAGLVLTSDKNILRAGDTARISVKTSGITTPFNFLGFVTSVNVPKDFDKPVLETADLAFPGYTYEFPYLAVVDKSTYWEVQSLAANSSSTPLNLTNDKVLFTFPVKLATTTTAIKTTNIAFVKDTTSGIPSVIDSAMAEVTLTTTDTSINLNPAVAPTITMDNVTKAYGDGPFTITHTVNSTGAKTFTSSNVNVATVTNSGVVTMVGAGTSTITLSVAAVTGFTSGSDTANLTVTAKALTVTGLTGTAKVYNRTTTASVTGTATLSGVINSDSVTLAGTPTYNFADSNVGSSKTITTSGYTLTGAKASNYVLTQPSLTGAITAKALTVTGLTGTAKVYNRTTTASVTGTAILSGVVSGDTVSISSTGVSYAFADVNIGSNKALTRTGSYTLTGASAGNYTLTQPTLIASITAKSVIGGFTADNKIYDGTTSATVLTRSISSGVISPDVVSLTAGTATFNNATVGDAKTVTLTGAVLSGANAGNYTLASVATTTANITPSNQAPTNITLVPSSFNENSAIGTVIGTLSTTDVNSSDTFTYTITGGDTSAFDIVGNVVKTKIVFDYETKSSYSLKIKSTDNGGLFYEKTLDITVNNVLVKGDLSNDDRVQVNDASILVGLVFAGGATPDQIARGDMNGDSKLDVRDAFLIIEQIFK